MLGELLSTCSLPLEIGCSPCSKTEEIFIGTSLTVIFFLPICNVKHTLGCKYSWQNIFNAKTFNPHKKPIPLLNMATCSQSMWRTWWPVVSTAVVSGFCWSLIQAVAWNWTRTDHYMNQCWVNMLRPRQDGRHFPDNILKRIFLNENLRISIKISLKFVPRHRPGDKP